MQALHKDAKLASRFAVETPPIDFGGCTPREKVVGSEMLMQVAFIGHLAVVIDELLSKPLVAVEVLAVDL